MAGTKSNALRNSQADSLVANLDSIELKDSSGTTIAEGSGISWDAASSGSVSPSSDITLTGNSNAGGGTDATDARIYDSGASGEEINSLNVTGTGGGGDVELDNTSVADGQTVTLPQGNVSITEPSSTA
jgi:tripartite-type tricarboxylate transporter receptor subunit TctC